MKATRAQIERALAKPDAAFRLYLLYGPDESGSRALGAKLAAGMGEGAERIDIAAVMLRQDPALLASEAAAISMFGGARYLRVESAGEECLGAVEALLEAPAAGNPVLLIAGNLRKDSKLLTLALAAPAALCFASYQPDAADGDRRIAELARAQGLQLSREAARRIFTDAGNDVAIAAREIEKLALYVDAAPDAPREIDEEAVAALAAAGREGDLDRLVDFVVGGRTDAAAAELGRLGSDGRDGVPLLNAVARRLLQLAAVRAAMDAGESVEAAMERARIFGRRDNAFPRQVAHWRSERIAASLDRIGEAQRLLRDAAGPGPIAAEAALLAIARAAARRA